MSLVPDEDIRPEEDFSALDAREFVPHIVIDPALLPVIEQDPNNAHRLICGDTSFLPTNAAIAERVALRHVAVWVFLARLEDQDRAAKSMAEAVRAARLDELVNEFYGHNAQLHRLPVPARKALERIADMEAEK